jgi:hypothetical protein
MEPYVIRGGKQGYERLLLLARDPVARPGDRMWRPC